MAQRKPTRLKKLSGTYRPDRAPEREPEPHAGRVSMPRGLLSASARRAWRAWAPELERLGLLRPLDVPLFTVACVWQGAAWDAARLLREEGIITPDSEGRPSKNRAVTILRAASVELRQLTKEFGLSPAARAGLSVPDGPAEVDVAELLLRMATETEGDSGDD